MIYGIDVGLSISNNRSTSALKGSGLAVRFLKVLDEAPNQRKTANSMDLSV